MKPEHKAKEAERLESDEVLIEALQQMKQEALEALAEADVQDTTNILRLQSQVAAVDGFRTMLTRFIIAGGSNADGRTAVT